MNRSVLSCVLVAIAFVATLFVGCSKPGQPASTPSQPKITGDPSDVPVALRINWQLGARYVLRMEMKQDSEFRRGNSADGRGGQQLNLAHEYAITVTNDPATGLRGLDVELLSIEMEETSGDRTFVSYDSQNRVTGTGGNPVAEQLARLVGGHVRYLIDSPNQRVVAENGVNELLARANSKSKNARKPDVSGPVNTQTLALESFKQMLALTALPERQFAVGDNWPITFESKNSPGGPVTVSTTNIFRGWQEHDRKKCARIELSGLLVSHRTNGNDDSNLRGGRRGMLFNEGLLSGVYWIDPASSFATEVTFDYSLSRSGAFGGSRKTAGQATNAAPPQTFTAKARQTISFKLIDMNLAPAGTSTPVITPAPIQTPESPITSTN